MYRKKLSRRENRSTFRKGTAIHSRNNIGAMIFRGGHRL